MYRSTVAAYGDVFMLPLSAENRDARGFAVLRAEREHEHVAVSRHGAATVSYTHLTLPTN